MKLYSIFNFLVYANNKREAFETFMNSQFCNLFLSLYGNRVYYNTDYACKKYINYVPITQAIDDTLILN